MNNVFAPLADLDFAALLSESYADTQTGRTLLSKYQQFMLTNESSCSIVNRFMIEAKNHLYDKGINKLFETISETVNDNLISWRLASACENINQSTASFNFLNRKAAQQVEALLENNSEENVVKYIKAGALKNVMYCEAFRTIVNSVYKDASYVVSENYTAISPVSFTEINEEGNIYFEVLGKIYKVDDNYIAEGNRQDVSKTFLMISQLLESPYTRFENDQMVVNLSNAKYTIYECDGDCVKCKRETKKKTQTKDGVKEEVITKEFEDVDSLREHNNMVVGMVTPNRRGEVAQLLETIARSMENFNKFSLLTNVKIVESMNDKFMVIEHKDQMFAMSLSSNHTNAWKINRNVLESLDFIKEKTKLNLNTMYKKNVEEAMDEKSKEEQKQIKEEIERDAMEARKKKIEKLTESFKNDPTKLAILSSVAKELNELQK